MSGLDLLQNNSRMASAAPYVPSGFGEALSSSLYSEYMRSPTLATVDEVDLMNKRNNRIREKLNVDNPFDLVDVSDIDAQFSNPTAEGRTESLRLKNERLDEYILAQRNSAPDIWSDIQTRNEFMAPRRETTRAASEISQDIASRASPFSGAAGSLIGGFGGAMLDPVNLATLPLGFGSSMGVLRAMAAEGALNAAIEAVQVPGRKKWLESAGLKYGLRQAAADVAFAGGGAAILTGIGRGAGKALKSFQNRGSEGMRIMSDMADNETVTVEASDALKYQSRVAHIDEENPIINPDLDDIAAHRSNLDETQIALRQKREPLYFDNGKVDPANVKISRTVTLSQSDRGLTPRNMERLKSRTSGNDIVIENAEFDSRAQADNYIRETAQSTGNDRTNYYVENYDGKHVVMESIPAAFDKDVSGNVLTFDQRRKASDVSKKGLMRGYVVPYGDKFAVVRFADGNNRSSEISKSKFVAEVSGGSDFSRAQAPQTIETVPQSTEAKAVMASEPVFESMNDALESMRLTAESGELAAPAYIADFQRLLLEKPDLEIDLDGQKMTIKQISEEIKENENILNAIRTCAIG